MSGKECLLDILKDNNKARVILATQDKGVLEECKDLPVPLVTNDDLKVTLGPLSDKVVEMSKKKTKAFSPEEEQKIK